MTELRHRLATRDDLAALRVLTDAAIGELQKPFLDAAEIASSRVIMGLDTQLVDDGTYFVVEQDGVLAGCGGWSRGHPLWRRRLTRAQRRAARSGHGGGAGPRHVHPTRCTRAGLAG